MDAPRNRLLILGAALSAIAALLHVGIIFAGPEWYRFFGAGERFAQLDAAGSRLPDLVTLGIATVIGLWSAYALSGAGVIRRLPLLRPALVAITTIYLLRGLVLLPLLLVDDFTPTPFDAWSSAICAGYGLVHLLGLVQAWPRLSPRAAAPIVLENAR